MIIKKIPVSKINPAPYNPRKDLKPGDEEYEKLKRSIEEFGYIESIVWNERTGYLVGGHQRFKILVDQGYTEVDVSVVNLDDKKEKELNIALNKISGEWNHEKLAELLNELKEANEDLTLTGFDEGEAEELINEFKLEETPKTIEDIEEDNFDIEKAVEEVKKNPIAKPGDIWILGKHRLMCGDSTSEEDVNKLMNGKKANMIFTDPPYNVNYEGGANGNRMKIQNDNMDSDMFYEFLMKVYKNYSTHTEPGGAIYVCHADSEGVNFRKAMIENGFLLKQCLVWVKNTFVLSRQDYHWQHEPILYGWKEGAAHTWSGDRRQRTVIEDPADVTITKQDGSYLLTFTNEERSIVIKVDDYEIVSVIEDGEKSVWREDKPQKSDDHPTMKPIAIPARGILNSSNPGELVIDLFGGSGSTLIAAEKTGRACYTMELEPVYCDVIIRRYEELTGDKAIKE